MKTNTTIFLSVVLLFTCLLSCGPKKTEDEPMDEAKTDTIQAIMYETDTVDVYSFKTYYQTSGNVDSIIVTSDGVSFVAIPEVVMARRAGMSDTLSTCLNKCKQPDGSYDLNCILRCPSKLQMRAVSRF